MPEATLKAYTQTAIVTATTGPGVVVRQTAPVAHVIKAVEAGPPGPPGDIPGFLAALSPASDTAPDVLIVRQGAEWMRATYAQLRLWAGARNTTTRGRAVTVGGLAVTTTE